ncbi:MAG: CHAP domain-containing protein [Candidatus Dormiibacterota bacterium]
MRRILRLGSAAFVTVLFGLVGMQPAFAAASPSVSPTPSAGGSASLDQLNQQLNQQQATLDKLMNQVESEQSAVATLNVKVADDQKQEATLSAQEAAVARIEYERPALSLTTILEAQNLDQLLSGMAQARLVSEKQQALYDQAKALREKDQATRSQATQQLAQIQSQRDQAKKVADQTESMIQTMNAQQQQAAAPKAQTQATQAVSIATGSPPGGIQYGATVPNRFAFGNCTYYVAQLRKITWMGNAIEWPSNAAAAGRPEGSTPEVGAIMVSADSSYGHVSLVTQVQDNDHWTVTEMNYSGFDQVDTRAVTRSSSNLITFIY